MTRIDEPAKVLTIAGSDSGGAAGLQADLKTFTALGVYGMSVVTAVTAQNSVQVQAVYPLPEELVIGQLQAVLSDYGAAAIKTGFIGRGDLIAAIARVLAEGDLDRSFSLIVDPVLVNHQGQAMFQSEVTEAYRRYLLPLCDLLTPNCAEAALLAGVAVTTLPAEVKDVARHLHQMGASNVLITAAREEGAVVDLFYDGHSFSEYRVERIETSNTHGSGDTLSAAITAFVAQKRPMPEAIGRAQRFTNAAIRGAAGWRLGQGHGPLNHLGNSGQNERRSV